MRQNNISPRVIALLFLVGRFIYLVSEPLEGLKGYGDLTHYFGLASLGNPFVDYWVEFPPIFPYLSRLLFLIAHGTEHIYFYLLFMILSLLQTVGLYLFVKIYLKINPSNPNPLVVWIYFSILLILPYGWWYFDAIPAFTLLLAIDCFLDGKDISGALAVAVGMLLKVFPVLLLPALWKIHNPHAVMRIYLIVASCVILVIGGFYLVSPSMTSASLLSQWNKGSWETVWALLDGNLKTGNFGPMADRFYPDKAYVTNGNPAVIPSFLSLACFAIIGLFIFLKIKVRDAWSFVTFLCITWCIFLLWSPGWSPQWILYLLPMILLAMHDREAILTAFILVLDNLLEWPLLLSRGYNWGLWMTIPLRTIVITMIAITLFSRLHELSKTPQIMETIG